MNKGFKLKSGWLVILNNEKQLLSNTWNVNNISQVRAADHQHANHMKQGQEAQLPLRKQGVSNVFLCS